MNNVSLLIPLLYHFIIAGVCTYLLIRGITHAFVCLFAAGALIEMIRSMGFFLVSLAPGGFSANASYLPLIGVVGYFGMLVFLAGFISLAAFLLRQQTPRV